MTSLSAESYAQHMLIYCNVKFGDFECFKNLFEINRNIISIRNKEINYLNEFADFLVKKASISSVNT